MKKLLLVLFAAISLNVFAQHPCVGPVVIISGDSIVCNRVKDSLFLNGPSATTYLWSDGETTTAIGTGPIDADSTFYVIANNGGCIDTTYYNVRVKLPPSVITPTKESFCSGTNVCIVPFVGGSGPFTYSWAPGGKTTDSICVSPSSTTVYTLTVSNGCNNTAEDTLVPVNCAGINTITTSSGYNIYPNPSSTSFTIDLQTKSLINVCDITGRILFSEMEKPGTITFGKELSPGIYFLFIDGVSGGKIVKL